MAAVCKTVGFAYPGSNPGPATIRMTSSAQGAVGDQVKPVMVGSYSLGMRPITGGLLDDPSAKVRVLGF